MRQFPKQCICDELEAREEMRENSLHVNRTYRFASDCPLSRAISLCKSPYSVRLIDRPGKVMKRTWWDSDALYQQLLQALHAFFSHLKIRMLAEPNFQNAVSWNCGVCESWILNVAAGCVTQKAVEWRIKEWGGKKAAFYAWYQSVLMKIMKRPILTGLASWVLLQGWQISIRKGQTFVFWMQFSHLSIQRSIEGIFGRENHHWAPYEQTC